MSLFDCYLFADYSGGSEDHLAQGNIRLYTASHDGQAPVRLSRHPGMTHAQAIAAGARPTNFSRVALRMRVAGLLSENDPRRLRIAFGFDHQYSWPPFLWAAAGLGEMNWRDAIRALADGDPATGRPPLDVPGRFCSAFNRWAGRDIFWTPLPHVAAAYEIGQQVPVIAPDDKFRLTELAPRAAHVSHPSAANAVGGHGAGVVGGQTICGLKQLAQLIDRPDVAWWPFDGLDIAAPAYEGKHVGIEIYPAAIRPVGVVANDDNDALHSCAYLRDQDMAGTLAGDLNLNGIAPPAQGRVRREGWIPGFAL